MSVGRRAANNRADGSAKPSPATHAESGTTLVVVVVATAALTVLGIGVLALAALERQSVQETVAARQASLAAESGLEIVKGWFDAPSSSAGTWLVPAPNEVDRAARCVDPEGDGTSVAYATAPAPWNVIYRVGRGDLFERPFRGSPELALCGIARGPDILISDDAREPSIRDFLARTSLALFPPGLDRSLVLRLRRIVIYGPPRVSLEGAPRMSGIASVEVTAIAVRVTADGEQIVASGRASGVLGEIPFRVPGPLATASGIPDGGGLDLRWGTVRVAGVVRLGADPKAATRGGWPWIDPGRRLVADMQGDGTAEDRDADTVTDFNEWLGLPDRSLDDPWFALLAGGAIEGAPGPGIQPFPFDPGAIPGTGSTDDDRSGLFQGLPGTVARAPDTGALRAGAIDGGAAVHYFRYIAGTDPPLFREGSSPPVDLQGATYGREGLFYFGTTNGLLPQDAGGDGTYDNLTPAIVVSDPGWWSSGCLVVNASSFEIRDSLRAGFFPMAPPGAPFDDRDADGTCDEDDSFVEIIYPSDPLAAGAGFERGRVLQCAGGAVRSALGPRFEAPASFAGLIVANGRIEGGVGARVFGAIAAAGEIAVGPPAPGGERLQILYDTRLGDGAWPSSGSRLPRTFWQRRSIAP